MRLPVVAAAAVERRAYYVGRGASPPTRPKWRLPLSIEKAFAIRATPSAIYEALERDLAGASAHAGETFEVLRREPGRLLELRVTIGDIPCWLTYRLQEKEDYTEVAAVLTPFGMKYALFRIITLGMRDQNFAVVLVQGLANLKEEVEGAHPASAS